MSLRARLLAGVAFVALILLGVSAVITARTRDQLIDQVDSRLVSFSPSRPNGDNDAGQFPMPDGDLPQPPPGFEDRLSDVYQGWIDASGTLHTRFFPSNAPEAVPDLTGLELDAGSDRIMTVESLDGSTTYRVRTESFATGTAVTALPIDDVQDTISELLMVEIVGALAILAALGLVAWWVIHLGIRPIKQMTDTATQISEGDLSVRVPEGAPGTEPGELATALNRMLSTIEDAIGQRAASEERLRQFVADASHELRTPITTIRGYAELYRHGGLAAGGSLDDAMRRTEQEAARMGRLVDDMLTLAKLDEERPLDTRPVDISRLASDAAADARASQPDRVVVLDVPDAGLTVTGDEDRLRQVIANVVGNALVHTSVEVTIVIRAVRRGDQVELSVEDDGQGMPAEVADRVTERFFRADPARSRHRGGSGLGLSIAEAAIAAHGGSIEIDSEPGRGTAVRLTLPAVQMSDGGEVNGRVS